MRLVEVEYRVTPGDADADTATAWTRYAGEIREGASSVAVEGLDLGVSYDIRCRHVDDITSAVSEWYTALGRVVEKDAGVPPALASLRLTKGDCLTWEMPMEVIDLRGYRIRHAPNVHEGGERGWGTAEPAHEDLISNPPFILCRVPKGPRTIIGRPVDWDDNEGEPLTLWTDRGAINDVAEFIVREVDEAAAGFVDGTLTGASPGTPLQATAYPGAASAAPMFTDGIEPWMSHDADAPMFSSDGDAPMFGETWGKDSPWFGRDPNALMFGSLYQWGEYTWSFTVRSWEGGPRAVLSVDVESAAIGWRLMYRQRNPLPWFDSDPFAPMFGAPTDPMFPDQSPKPWRPWPGRLLDVEIGRYDFRLILPGGRSQWTVSRLKVSLSSEARMRHVSGLVVPANGGTRAPPGDEWRKIVHVQPIAMTSAARLVPVAHKSKGSGPALRVFDPLTGAQVATVVDVTIRGY